MFILWHQRGALQVLGKAYFEQHELSETTFWDWKKFSLHFYLKKNFDFHYKKKFPYFSKFDPNLGGGGRFTPSIEVIMIMRGRVDPFFSTTQLTSRMYY